MNKIFKIGRCGTCNCFVQDDLELPDDGGEIPKSQGRGWRYDSRLWSLSTSHKSCHVVNCLLCFGVSLSAFCLKTCNHWI